MARFIPFAGLDHTSWTPIARCCATAMPREWEAVEGQEQLYKRVQDNMKAHMRPVGDVATARVDGHFVLLWKAAP